MNWLHLFVPNRHTHKKAHLISWEGIAVYITLFLVLQSTISLVGFLKPGILGISANIDQHRLIELTNLEREKLGLPALSESSMLDEAAQAKAANMFEENYWAHFSPSGRDPWGFILGAGYRFTFAGENLAKNFENPEDIVAAWMTSPSHRDNIINSKYKEIGIAVVNGVLEGQETTLVVQMFATTATSLASAPKKLEVEVQPVPPSLNEISPTPQPLANIGGQEYVVSQQDYDKDYQRVLLPSNISLKSEGKFPLINSRLLTKNFTLGIIALMGVFLVVDLLILRHRKVYRITSHHLAHMAILSVAAVTILNSNSGELTDQGLSFKSPYVLEQQNLNLK